MGNLQEEISMIESELAEPLPIRSLHNMTSEEIAKSITRPGLETKLAEIKEQEKVLLSKKQATLALCPCPPHVTLNPDKKIQKGWIENG